MDLRTARLRLRAPRSGDEDDIVRYASDPEVTRYLSWATHRSTADTRAFVAHALSSWTTGTDFAYVAELDGRVVGGTGLTPVAPGRARTGYVLARDVWGQGLATEMLVAMGEVARAAGLKVVEAFVHPDNAASIRVLQKGGYQQVGFGPRCGVLPNLGLAPDVFTYERTLG